MEPQPLGVPVGSLGSMPDAHVLRAYRFLAGDVQAMLERGGADARSLAAARRDAETFGLEALRRGLLES